MSAGLDVSYERKRGVLLEIHRAVETSGGYGHDIYTLPFVVGDIEAADSLVDNREFLRRSSQNGCYSPGGNFLEALRVFGVIS